MRDHRRRRARRSGGAEAGAAAAAARPLHLVTDAMPCVGSAETSFELQGKTITVRDGACFDDDGTPGRLGARHGQRGAQRRAAAGPRPRRRLAHGQPQPGRVPRPRRTSSAASRRGYFADLVLLDDDLQVLDTWIRGRASAEADAAAARALGCSRRLRAVWPRLGRARSWRWPDAGEPAPVETRRHHAAAARRRGAPTAPRSTLADGDPVVVAPRRRRRAAGRRAIWPDLVLKTRGLKLAAGGRARAVRDRDRAGARRRPQRREGYTLDVADSGARIIGLVRRRPVLRRGDPLAADDRRRRRRAR